MTEPASSPIWRPYTQMKTAAPPLKVIGADGAYILTDDGRRILDGISSWWVNIHGHNHPRLNRALAEQSRKFSQVIFAGFTHEAAEQLAGELVKRSPAGLSHVFFSDDGSTAVEAALKMAYQYWRNIGDNERTIFVSLAQAYHGDTLGAMSVSRIPEFHETFKPLMFDTTRTVDHPAGGGRSIDDVIAECGDRIAAVVIEPMVQGAAGMIMWPDSFLREVRTATAEAGIPLIADEVFTGFGRTGKMFACEHGPITPDIMCLSKAITGGYLPLGVTLCTDRIYEAFLSTDPGKAFLHGHSFTGNALSAALALESLELFDENECLVTVQGFEKQFRERLKELDTLETVQNTRCLGGIAALDIKPQEAAGYFDPVGRSLHAEFLERDILLRPLGNTLYFLPPYVVTPGEIDMVFDAMWEVLSGFEVTTA